jgi:hypothetical protein
VDQSEDLLRYRSVYYNSQVSANIISFFNMAKKFKSLVYDNQQKDAFIVTRDDRTKYLSPQRMDSTTTILPIV